MNELADENSTLTLKKLESEIQQLRKSSKLLEVFALVAAAIATAIAGSVGVWQSSEVAAIDEARKSEKAVESREWIEKASASIVGSNSGQPRETAIKELENWRDSIQDSASEVSYLHELLAEMGGYRRQIFFSNQEGTFPATLVMGTTILRDKSDVSPVWIKVYEQEESTAIGFVCKVTLPEIAGEWIDFSVISIEPWCLEVKSTKLTSNKATIEIVIDRWGIDFNQKAYRHEGFTQPYWDELFAKDKSIQTAEDNHPAPIGSPIKIVWMALEKDTVDDNG